MRWRAVVVVLFLGTVIATACQPTHPPDPGTAGASLYVKAGCWSCHGVDAGGLLAPSLRKGLSATAAEQALRDGRPGMASSRTCRHAPAQTVCRTLSDDEIHTLALYIERIGK